MPFAVIVETTVEAWHAEGLPSHGEYPKVAEGAGFGLAGDVLIAALPTERAVADALVEWLGTAGVSAHVVDAPSMLGEDVQLLVLDRALPSGNGAPLRALAVCLGEVAEHCWAVAQPLADGRLALPFVADRPEARLFIDAGEPWTCGPGELGRVPESLVWRRAPVAATCWESAEKKKRKRRQ